MNAEERSETIRMIQPTIQWLGQLIRSARCLGIESITIPTIHLDTAMEMIELLHNDNNAQGEAIQYLQSQLESNATDERLFNATLDQLVELASFDDSESDDNATI